jgi:hypothetical protein
MLMEPGKRKPSSFGTERHFATVLLVVTIRKNKNVPGHLLAWLLKSTTTGAWKNSVVQVPPNDSLIHPKGRP